VLRGPSRETLPRHRALAGLAVELEAIRVRDLVIELVGDLSLPLWQWRHRDRRAC
jgi:hypothetical protein